MAHPVHSSDIDESKATVAIVLPARSSFWLESAVLLKEVIKTLDHSAVLIVVSQLLTGHLSNF
jgi:hypothetical protein